MTTVHSTEGPGTEEPGTDGWAAAVRRRLGLGRLLPMGGPADGLWLTEEAARAELRRVTAAQVPSVSLGRLSIEAGPDGPGLPVVPPPPGTPAPEVLRIDAECAATSGEPLPALALRLRETLFERATGWLGLPVAEVNLRVTDLWEEADGARGRAPEGTPGKSPESAGPVGGGEAARQGGTAQVVASVPGVAYPTRALGSAVTVTAEHVRVELASAAGHHPPTVARAVREALAKAGVGPVSVLVTAVEVAVPPSGVSP